MKGIAEGIGTALTWAAIAFVAYLILLAVIGLGQYDPNTCPFALPPHDQQPCETEYLR